MTKRGRKNKYDTHVKPYLETIRDMCRTSTERQIAEYLGISYSTFAEYKKKYSDLSETIKKGRQNLVSDLRGALISRALGYNYTESKVVSEQLKVSDELRKRMIEAGFEEQEIDEVRVVKTEVAKKKVHPDVAALNLALKNYDAENWANDPQMMELRKQELELRKQIAEDNSW